MVVMRRDVPEKVGHPTEINVQECDIDTLQKRGWYVVTQKAVETKPEVKLEEKSEVTQTVQSNDEPVDNKPRRTPKRHEV